MSRELFCMLSRPRANGSGKVAPSLMDVCMNTSGISSLGEPGFLKRAIKACNEREYPVAHGALERYTRDKPYAVRCGRIYQYAHERRDVGLFIVSDALVAVTGSNEHHLDKVSLSPIITELTGDCHVGLELPNGLPVFGGSLMETSALRFIEVVLNYSSGSTAKAKEIQRAMVLAYASEYLVFPLPRP